MKKTIQSLTVILLLGLSTQGCKNAQAFHNNSKYAGIGYPEVAAEVAYNSYGVAPLHRMECWEVNSLITCSGEIKLADTGSGVDEAAIFPVEVRCTKVPDGPTARTCRVLE